MREWLNYITSIGADFTALSKLVIKSKASNSYSSEFMEKCRGELLVTPRSLKNGPSRLAWHTNRNEPVGFVQVVAKNSNRCELEALFLDPSFQGQGVGHVLFKWAISQVLHLNYSSIIINSDPGAERFYLSSGAVRVGETPSGSIPGRLLPQLVYYLE